MMFWSGVGKEPGFGLGLKIGGPTGLGLTICELDFYILNNPNITLIFFDSQLFLTMIQAFFHFLRQLYFLKLNYDQVFLENETIIVS